MRYVFGKTLAELARQDEKIWAIAADIGYGVFDEFKREFPDRFLNVGVTEQATMGLATGMAMEGFQPWLYSITPFFLRRAYEQIYLDVVEHKANVKIVTYGEYPGTGPTHETTREEVEGLCKILGIRLIVPTDGDDTRKQVIEAHQTVEPIFFYLLKDRKGKSDKFRL